MSGEEWGQENMQEILPAFDIRLIPCVSSEYCRKSRKSSIPKTSQSHSATRLPQSQPIIRSPHTLLWQGEASLIILSFFSVKGTWIFGEPMK